MGRCHEFGSQIREGCAHPMRAGRDSCSCPECGVVCEGQFDGCPDVWARGPRLVRAPDPEPESATAPSDPKPARSGADAGPTAEPGVEQVITLGRPRRLNRASADELAPAAAPAAAFTGTAATAMPSMEEPRSEVLRWFEEAFEGLRGELRALVGGMTQQQAMMAELMETRQADLRLVMVAESLPLLVDDAVRKAMGDHAVHMIDFVDSSLGDFKETLLKREDAARKAAKAADTEQVAGLEAVRTAVVKQLRPIAHAIQAAVDLQEEAKEEDAARLPALKASLTRQLRPLEEAAERSDERLTEIAGQLKRLAKPAPPSSPASPPAPPAGAARNGGAPKTRPAARRR